MSSNLREKRERAQGLTTLSDLHRQNSGALQLKVDYNNIGLGKPIGDQLGKTF